MYPLLIFSPIYALAAAVIRRIQSSQKQCLRCPVIVVGNLTVGGTGKTPLVIVLAQYLEKHGYMPGIISGGYKGKKRSLPRIVDTTDTAADIGDEALMLSHKTHYPIAVCSNRRRAIEHLLAQRQEVEVIVTDDGLQNYTIPHHIEIVVIDGQRRFGNGFLLPAGPLRESVKRLGKVDFKVTNGIAQADEFQMKLHAVEIVNCADGNSSALEIWHGKTVHACAGIGNPDNFFNLLREHGMHVHEHAFPDHYAFSAADMHFNDDLPIVMTEKDAVKCQKFAQINMWVLRVQAEVDEHFYHVFFTQFKQLLKRYE